jgi:hypothetical protein
VTRALAIEGARREVAGEQEEKPHEEGRIDAKEYRRSHERRIGQGDFRGMRIDIGLDRMVSDHKHDEDDAQRVYISEVAQGADGGGCRSRRRRS